MSDEGYIGTGGGIASGNGFPEVNFQGFLNKNIGSSFEQAQQKFVFPDAASYTVGRLFKDLQAMGQSMSIQSMTAGQTFSPGNLVSLNTSGKVASLFGGK